MSNSQDNSIVRRIEELSRAIGIVLLMGHVYYFCYDAFEGWGLSTIFTDRILLGVEQTGLFDNIVRSKSMALIFLTLSLLGNRGRKDKKISRRSAWWLILPGLVIYFGSLVLLPQQPSAAGAVWYILFSFAGFLLVLAGGVRLSRAHPAGRKQGGDAQEEHRIQKGKSRLERLWFGVAHLDPTGKPL